MASKKYTDKFLSTINYLKAVESVFPAHNI